MTKPPLESLPRFLEGNASSSSLSLLSKIALMLCRVCLALPNLCRMMSSRISVMSAIAFTSDTSLFVITLKPASSRACSPAISTCNFKSWFSVNRGCFAMGSVATIWTVPRSIACDGGVALVRWRGSPKQYRDTDVRPQSLSKNGYGRRTIRALCDLGVCI